MSFLPQIRRFIFIFNLDNGALRNNFVSYQHNVSKHQFKHQSTYLSRVNDITKGNDSKLKVVFFGTDLLSIQILSGLNSLLLKNVIGEIKVITSVSLPVNDKKKESLNGFDNLVGNQIINYCESNSLKYNVWSDIKSNTEMLSTYDVGVVASFGHLLPGKLIEKFPQ